MTDTSAQAAVRHSADAGLPAVSVPERVHTDTGVLLWQARGSSSLTIGGERQHLAAGYALWIPPRTTHALEVAEDSVVLPVLVRRPPTHGVLLDPSWIAVDVTLRTMILALLQTQNSIIRPGVDLEHRLVGMLRERIVASTALSIPAAAPARAVAEQLRDDPADERSIEEWAAEQHVSARTLQRAFATETGLTLQQWRARRRMEVAAALLRQGHPLCSIAARAGYRSDSAFRRAFKEQFGVAPSSYARRFAVAR